MDVPVPSPKVSIVIPLYNRVELTRQCWASLGEAGLPPFPCEVVFVDNASSDATGPFLEGLRGSVRPPVTVLRNEANVGFARACNQAAKASRGGIVVFLNNDTVVHPGWLDALVEELDANPDAGVVGGRLLYPDGSIQHAGIAISRKHIPYHLFLGAAADDPLVTSRREFRMVTGACMAVRRDEFLALGGFDEGYLNGHEDVDLCLRYGAAGRQVVYRPESVVTHYESQSEGRFDHCRANTERTLLRWHGRLEQDDFHYLFEEDRRRRPARALSFVFKVPQADRAAQPGAAARRAEALAAGLCLRGHRCRIHYRDDWGLDDLDADVVLALPGRTRYAPKPYSRTALLVACEQDLAHVRAADAAACDAVLCVPALAPRLRALCPQASVVALDLDAPDPECEALDGVESLLAGLALTRKQPPLLAGSVPTVSVLMATRNRRELLPQAIDSVLRQTHAAWELVIVNDGGESVADVIEGYEDPRIISVDGPKRSKGGCINAAFTRSTGEYVAYLDDDDVWRPDHLERALFFLRTIPGVRMTYSDMVETTLELGADGWRTVRSRPLPAPQVGFADLLECNCIPGITVVHERELFEQAGGMDPRLEVLVDFDLWRRLAQLTEPYHISALTAERFFRNAGAPDVQITGQITGLSTLDRRRYLANACRILRKPLPSSVSDELRAEQDAVRRKVQGLFLCAQGDHYARAGRHERASACYRLAARHSLQLGRDLMKALFHPGQDA